MKRPLERAVFAIFLIGLLVASALNLSSLPLPAGSTEPPSHSLPTFAGGANGTGTGAAPAPGIPTIPTDTWGGVSITRLPQNSTPLPSAAEWLAYDHGTKSFYVAAPAGNHGYVDVIPGGSNYVTASIPVGSDPFGVAYDPATAEIFVTNGGSANVSVISDQQAKVTGTVGVGSSPAGIAYDAANGLIYVANSGSSSVTVINATTLAPVATIAVGSGPTGVAYDPVGENIYVTDQGSAQVTVLSAAGFFAIANISVAPYPYSIAVDSASGDVYASAEYGSTATGYALEMSVLSPRTLGLLQSIPLLGITDAWGSTYDAATQTIWVAGSGVLVVNATNQSEIGVLTVDPYGAAYDADNGQVCVPNISNSSFDCLNSLAPLVGGNVAYVLTFSEVGLPAGISWSFTSSLGSGSTTGRTYSLVDDYQYAPTSGTYTVSPPTGYVASPTSGTFDVGNGPENLSIAFSPASVRSFSVTFDETGLPSGTTWAVVLGGATMGASSSAISFVELNGTYSYTVGTVAGYVASPAAGSVTVAGATSALTIAFAKSPSSTSAAFFDQYNATYCGTAGGAGLGHTSPAVNPGGRCYANLTGVKAGDALIFEIYTSEGCGVAPKVSTSLGTAFSLNVSAGPAVDNAGINSNGSSYPASPTEFCSWTWVYLNAPGGTAVFSWIADACPTSPNYCESGGPTVDYMAFLTEVHGAAGIDPAGTGAMVTTPNGVGGSSVSLPYNTSAAGDFLYSTIAYLRCTGSVTAPAGWTQLANNPPSSTSGNTCGNTGGGYPSYESNASITLNGRATWPSLNRVAGGGEIIPLTAGAASGPRSYEVNFQESGLPPATNWSVTVNGTTQSTTAGAVPFSLANGSYSFTDGAAAGYESDRPLGTVLVAGASVAVSLTFSPSPTFLRFANISLGAQPEDQLYDPVNGYVYALETSTNDVAILRGTTVLASVAVGPLPDIAVLDSVNGLVYITSDCPSANPCSGGWLDVLNATTLMAQLTLPNPPGAGAFDPVYNTIDFIEETPPGYWTNVTLISGISVRATIALPPRSAADYLSVDTRNGLVYVPDTQGFVYVLNSTQVIASVGISYNEEPFASTFDPADGYTYVADGGCLDWGTGCGVNVLNGTRVVANFTGFGGYNGGTSVPVYDPADGAMYVGEGESCRVAVFQGRSLIASIVLPSYATSPFCPAEFFYDPGTADILALQDGSANSSLINGTTIVGLAPFAPAVAAFDAANTYLYVGTNAGESIYVTASSSVYPVTFTETGLPAGTSWSVTLKGSIGTSTTGTITFPEPNGTYPFSIGAAAGYSANPSSGSLSVSGTGASASVRFTAAAVYPVSFSESGLPVGTSWSVTMINTTISTTGSSLAFGQANGTYSYGVGPVSGYAASPSSGSLTVAGAGLSVLITFTPGKPAFYAVAFTETGLPAGTSWSVVVANSSSVRTTNSSLVFAEPNGSYSYTVGGVLGYVASAVRGFFNVNGAPVNVSIAFVGRTYSVTFNESGLRSGTRWSVTVGGSTLSSSSSEVAFSLANGTYSYSVAPVAGYATGGSGTFPVNGSAVVLSIRFTAILYAVAFTESGLPSGANWSATLANQTLTTTSSSLTFREPNGTFSFRVNGSSGYVASPSSGTITVSGNSVGLSLVFSPPPSYAVTFAASGLSAGRAWSVTVRNGSGSATTTATTGTTTNASLTLYLTAGPYLYNASSPGYPGVSGSFYVHNSTQTIPIPFVLRQYSVSFDASGLANGTTWTIVFNGSSYSSTTARLSLAVGNGSYAYFVDPVTGYLRSPSAGTLVVQGTPVTIGIDFTRAGFSVRFSETGLPTGTRWSVNLSGQSMNSTTSSMTFVLPNGTYLYSVGALSGYSANASSGRLVVNGGGLQISIAFSSTSVYTVTFAETGLPGGKLWSLVVNSTGGGSVSASTTNSSIVLFEPVGTYTYVASSGGYRGSSGTFTMSGAAVTVNVGFSSASSEYAVTFNETGLPAGVRWSVSFGGSTWSTTSTGLVVFAINGSWNYSIASPAGYSTATPTGHVRVLGAPVTLSIVFFPSAPATYPVTFQTTGLPGGTHWTITVGGATYASSADNLTVELGNGSYPYTLGPVAGYVASPWSGTFGVNGARLTVVLNFRAYLYAISISETGLPSGTTWTVQVISASSSSFGASSQTSTLALDLANGTYQLVVTVSNSSWQTVNQTVGLTVNGASTSVLVVFLYAYVATFEASGQTSGTTWYVNLTGTVAAGQDSGREGAAGLLVRYTFESALPTVSISLPNGSYTYSISSTDPRWVPSVAAGSFAVEGHAPPVVRVTGAPPTVSGLGAETYGLIGLGLAAVAIGALLAGREWYTRPPRKRGGADSKQLYGSYRVPRRPAQGPAPPGTADDIL